MLEKPSEPLSFLSKLKKAHPTVGDSIMNDLEKCSIKMFEYLELRSSVLLTDINRLLSHLRNEAKPGNEWKIICAQLKAKQDELETIFERIRIEIETASTERAAREVMLSHFETTVNTLIHH